jgi:hypothetical protein
MTQILTAIATHSLALVVYPGLLTVVIFGLVEIANRRVVLGTWNVRMPGAGERPSPVLATVAVSILVAVQLAAPFNPAFGRAKRHRGRDRPALHGLGGAGVDG